MSGLKYRADIDGLRAVSVLAVILFHAGFGFGGGYIGVDAFFVISGFLITGLIVKDLEAGSFSLARFWKRRIKRIWPMALAVTGAALAAGYFLLMPGAYVVLAYDAIAQVLMLANWRFAVTQGYFDGPADLRPLLHMWSLAVEEQFYVFFPVVLLLVWRFGRRAVVGILVAIAAVSLGLSVWGTQAHPSATFYFLPTRMWELLVGSLLAVLRPGPLRSRPLREGLSFVGLAMLLVPVFVYDSSTPFPGVAALPPCLGTGLLIYTGGAGVGVVRRVLSTGPMRLIGLMSYSLYLWHWPVLSFMRHTMGDDISAANRVLVLVAVFVVSFFSWRLVETPARKVSDSVSLWRIAGGAAVVSGVLLLAGLLIHVSRGVPDRFEEDIRALGDPGPIVRPWDYNGPLQESSKWKPAVPIGAQRPDAAGIQFLLWGDSHASVISSTVHAVAASLDLPGAAAIRSATLPVPGIWRPSLGTMGLARAEWNDRVFQWLESHDVKTLLLCGRWSVNLDEKLVVPLGTDHATEDAACDALRDGLQDLLDRCQEEDVFVYILTEIPFQGLRPEQRAIGAHVRGLPAPTVGVGIDEHRRHQRLVESVMGQLRGDNFQIVPLADALLTSSGDSMIVFDGKGLYFDDDHLSSAGAEALLTPLLTRVLSGGPEQP